MKILLTALFFLIFLHAGMAQVLPEEWLPGRVKVDRHFKDTLTFDKQWDYRWYVSVEENGSIVNLIGGELKPEDTVRLYHTARCTTNHQGEHAVRYCYATLENDTLRLFFTEGLPAYVGMLAVLIKGDRLRSDFYANYFGPIMESEKIVRKTTKQKLILDKDRYEIGDTVKGYLDVEFTETQTVPNKKPSKVKNYFRGFFKTPVLKPEEAHKGNDQGN